MYILNKLGDVVCGTLLPAILFVSGTVFFFSLAGFIFKIKKRPKQKSSRKQSGASALWLALGGTLGVGNITGVCSAVYLGGAGCVFWIWVCAILCAATKYAETVLAVGYRETDGNGKAHGGAPYYMEKGLGSKLLPRVFCVLCVICAFTLGNCTQINAASELGQITLGAKRWVFAVFFAVCLFFITGGRGDGIKKFTSRVVPFLCVGYSVLCLWTVFLFRENVPSVTARIFREAFTPQAGMGGVAAYICSPALRLGITRGVTSNEAGCGTAPFAYASDPDTDAVRSGHLGIAEVLIDTLVLCTLTAYAVLTPGITLSESASESVTDAFYATGATAVLPLLGISASVFALASASAWSFYAARACEYLGFKKGKFPFFALLYSAFAALSCFFSEAWAWTLSDITVSAMASLNIFTLLLMIGRIRDITKSDSAL